MISIDLVCVRLILCISVSVLIIFDLLVCRIDLYEKMVENAKPWSLFVSFMVSVFPRNNVDIALATVMFMKFENEF